MGGGVPQIVLDALGKTVSRWADITEAILRDVDSDVDNDGDSLSASLTLFPDNINGISIGWLAPRNEHDIYGSHHISDIYLLIEMLPIPSFFVDVSQVFVRAVSRGVFTLQSTAMVLEMRRCRNGDLMEKKDEKVAAQGDDYTSLLNLGQVLSLSKDPKVQDFVRMFYAVVFKIYADSDHHERLLKTLVENATSSSDGQVVDIDMDVLAFLMREEEGVSRQVIEMLRKVCELANIDRSTLWHQLCAMESQNLRAQEDQQAEVANISQEKSILAQKLSDSEATIIRLKVSL